MKTYSKNIGKLYETIGFEKLEKGKSYTTSKGSKVVIEDIFIDATEEVAEAYVAYSFESAEGKKGKETNRFRVVVDMIRNT